MVSSYWLEGSSSAYRIEKRIVNQQRLSPVAASRSGSEACALSPWDLGSSGVDRPTVLFLSGVLAK